MMYEFLFSQISNWIGLQDNNTTSKLLKTRRFTKNTKKIKKTPSDLLGVFLFFTLRQHLLLEDHDRLQ